MRLNVILVKFLLELLSAWIFTATNLYSYYVRCSIFFAVVCVGSFFFFFPYTIYDKAGHKVVDGTVRSMQTTRIGQNTDWVITLMGDDKLYRLMPISNEFVKRTEIQRKLPPGTRVVLVVTPYSNNAAYNIMEIKSGNNIILDFDDMVKRVQKDDSGMRKAGIIVLSICLSMSLISLIAGIRAKNKAAAGKYDEIEIGVRYMGNLLEVYSSFERELVLIINGEVADKHNYRISPPCQLQGKILTCDGEKNIHLKMNSWGVARLYYEDMLLAKKWILYTEFNFIK